MKTPHEDLLSIWEKYCSCFGFKISYVSWKNAWALLFNLKHVLGLGKDRIMPHMQRSIGCKAAAELIQRYPIEVVRSLAGIAKENLEHSKAMLDYYKWFMGTIVLFFTIFSLLDFYYYDLLDLQNSDSKQKWEFIREDLYFFVRWLIVFLVAFLWTVFKWHALSLALQMCSVIQIELERRNCAMSKCRDDGITETS